MYPPQFEPVNAEQTFATKEMLRFFEIDFETNLSYYHDKLEEDGVYIATSGRFKRKIIHPELSIWKQMLRMNKKLFFGAPNPLFQIEDIVLSNSLEELRHIFYSSLDRMNQRWVDENQAVATEPTDFL